MEIFVFFIATLALIWGAKSRSAVARLEEKHQLFLKQVDQLNHQLAKVASDLASLRESGRNAEPPPAQPEPMIVASPIATPVPAAEVKPVSPPTPPQQPPDRAATPPAQRPQPRPLRPPAPPVPPKPAFDWEALIGVKLFSWIAGVALVFAAVFFLKYSVEHGWLSPPVRMAIGLLVGSALLAACEWKAVRRYAVTANALEAAGIAILFSTFFAAHALWNLIGVLPTFGLMAMVTAVAVLLSIRHDSVFVALLGLVGGFATPALLSTGQDRPIGLFGYLLLLNAGLAWVAYRKRWPYLTVLSAVFTTIYQWAWVMKFLRAGSVPLTLGIFMVFPILSFVALALGEKKDSEDESSLLFGRTSAISVALPLLFALFMAAVPAYGDRYWLLFGFLFFVDAGLAAIASKKGPELLHLSAGIATLVTFCIWLQMSYKSAAWPAVLFITAGFVLFYLGVGYARLGFNDVGTRGVFAAPLLLVVFPILAGIEPAAASPVALFAVLFGLMAVLAAYAVVREEGAIHFLAAFFALAAEAVWSARHLEPRRLLSALSIYAIFGLFYLGVPLLARRWGKRLKPEGSGAILLFASLGLLFFLAAGPVASAALWGIALLLTIMNLGLFLEASSGRRPLLLLAGLVLSWAVIAVWWTTVSLIALLIPGLVVVGGFAILILGGNIWAARRVEAEGASDEFVFSQGLYLALVGHAFLFFVVLQKPLAVPPWPFLGVLALLDLAIGVAALYSRRGELHLGALAASQAILIVWQLTVETRPWPSVAVLCALGIAAMGLVWFRLSRAGTLFAAASAVASLLGLVVVFIAETLPGSPEVRLVAVASIIFLCFILAVDWFSEWHFLAPLSVVVGAFVSFEWSYKHFKPENWSQEFLFAAAIYAVFLAYPLLLGGRAKILLEPYLAAVMASVPFFYFARHSLLAAGFADRIGLLPVTQAALMAGLLWKLLRLEPPGRRTLGRMAMVAGAVLAFVTVAIPLQLEKQWITIGWALLAAGLGWLWRRIPHHGLVVWTGGLLAAVFVRLVLNPAVFSYHPRGGMPILNWYLYTYLVSAAAFFATAWLLRYQVDVILNGVPRITTLAASGGTVLLFLLLNIEIADYYSKGPNLTFNFDAGLAQDLTYTIGWGIFAFGLLIAAIFLDSKAGRVSAIVLLSVTVAKCFLHDLWRLGGLYRVGSFVGLAMCLTLVALLLQKFVLRPQNEAE